MALTRYLRFIVNGIAKPLLFGVEKSVWDRVSSVFEQYRDGSVPSFIDFPTKNTRRVYLNTRFVLVYQALAQTDNERSENIQLLSADTNKENRITFIIDGIDEALHYDDIDDVGLIDLITGLKSYNSDKHRFISFMDINGGQHAICGDCLILVEAPNYDVEKEEELS